MHRKTRANSGQWNIVIMQTLSLTITIKKGNDNRLIDLHVCGPTTTHKNASIDCSPFNSMVSLRVWDRASLHEFSSFCLFVLKMQTVQSVIVRPGWIQCWRLTSNHKLLLLFWFFSVAVFPLQLMLSSLWLFKLIKIAIWAHTRCCSTDVLTGQGTKLHSQSCLLSHRRSFELTSRSARIKMFWEAIEGYLKVWSESLHLHDPRTCACYWKFCVRFWERANR